jgi:putative ABC transport system ATP-binding protein
MGLLSFTGAVADHHQPVDLVVQPGETIVIVDDDDHETGALLLCALGLAPLRAGRAELFGVDVAEATHDDLRALRMRAALASLQAPLLSNLNARDNLVVPLAMRSVDQSRARADVDAIIAEAGLEAACTRRPHDLLPRHHREFLLARALLLPAELFLLDEPPPSSKLLHRLPALTDAGAAIVITTSSAALMETLDVVTAQRVVRLATDASTAGLPGR